MLYVCTPRFNYVRYPWLSSSTLAEQASIVWIIAAQLAHSCGHRSGSHVHDIDVQSFNLFVTENASAYQST